MPRRTAWCLAVALFAPATLPAQAPPAPPPAAQPQGKLVQDVWETAYLDGCRVGYTHLIVEEFTAQHVAECVNRLRVAN